MLDTHKLYGLMKFKGYATRNLDDAAEFHRNKYKQEPEAFMVRSPYMIRGSDENKKLMVISPKYGGFAAVYIPTILNKEKLERILSELPQANHKLYVMRRRQEIAITTAIVEEHERRQSIKRHCNYCGAIYNTTVLALTYHCSKSECRMKHKEYLEEMKLRRQEQLTHKKEKEAKELSRRKNESESMPEFTMETPLSSSFQGWVYFIEAQNGYVKIGRSDDPSKRFIDISNMSPIPLWLRHTVFSDNYIMAEARVHKMFDKYRRHGEWFELPAEIFERCLEFDHYDFDNDITS